MYYLLLILVISLQLTILFTMYNRDNKSKKHSTFKSGDGSPSPLNSSMKGVVKSRIKPKALNTENVDKVLKIVRQKNIPFSYYEGTGQITFTKGDELVNYFFTTGTLLYKGTMTTEYKVDDLIKNWL